MTAALSPARTIFIDRAIVGLAVGPREGLHTALAGMSDFGGGHSREKRIEGPVMESPEVRFNAK
jgi:hypothetical protein